VPLQPATTRTVANTAAAISIFDTMRLVPAGPPHHDQSLAHDQGGTASPARCLPHSPYRNITLQYEVQLRHRDSSDK
jgi:hypothetical protein